MKPWDKVKPQSKDTRVFLLLNSCGYIININNPEVLPLYKQFKEKNKIPTYAPLSDDERFKFEKELIKSEQFKERFDAWYSEYNYFMPIKTSQTIDKMIGNKNAKRQ